MPSSRSTAVVVIALALGAVSGCASANRAAPGTKPVATAAATTSTPATLKESADHDVTILLANFRPPTGATRLSAQPAGSKFLAANSFAGPNTAVTTSWWRTTGDPQTVVAHVATPSGGSNGDSWNSGGPDGATYSISFDYPKQGALVGRTLAVTAGRVGTATILRVDATTIWVPARSPATLVPATARSLVVSFQGRPGPAGPAVNKGPVTITDPAEVATVVKVTDAAQVEPYGVRPCPASMSRLELSFRSATGVEVAYADASPGGCDDIGLTVGSTDVTLSGATQFTATVLASLHLPWGSGK